MRSALMFATLAASADYCAVLYCIQTDMDVMVTGAIEEEEKPQPNVPTLRQRLRWAWRFSVIRKPWSTSTLQKRIFSRRQASGSHGPHHPYSAGSGIVVLLRDACYSPADGTSHSDYVVNRTPRTAGWWLSGKAWIGRRLNEHLNLAQKNEI
jgi:hypothetical protein